MRLLGRSLGRRSVALLGVLLLLTCCGLWSWLNWQWSKLDQFPLPPEEDCAKYVFNAHDIAAELLLNQRPLEFRQLIHAWRKYPVLSWNVYALLPAALVTAKGPDRPSEVLAMAPFLVLLVLGAAALGWVTFGPAEGVLAGLIALCIPGVIGFSRVTHLEVPAMAIAAWIPAVAWAARRPGNWMGAALLGLLAAAGLFVRYEFPIYAVPALFGPALYWLLALRPGRVEDTRGPLLRGMLLSLMAAGIAFAVVARLWLDELPRGALEMIKYGWRYGPVFSEYSIRPEFIGRKLLIVPSELYNVFLEPTLSKLALLGLAIAWFRPGGDRRAVAHVALTALSGFAMFSYLENKEARRLLLLVPALSVLIAVGLNTLRLRLGSLKPLATLAICLLLANVGWRCFELSFIPQAGEGRRFQLEKDVPSVPRSDRPEVTNAAAALLKYGDWPAHSRVGVFESVNVPFLQIRMRTLYRGMDVFSVFLDEQAEQPDGQLADLVDQRPELMLGPEREVCGPQTRRTIFSNIEPGRLDELCAALPQYRAVNTTHDRDGKLLYVLRRVD
ncbi:MAG: hypothetical protein P9M14_06395 [Candidatus Alcyoniella australis]|nr:hypothetical protein [Candidatus Alcyoniella australis]